MNREALRRFIKACCVEEGDFTLANGGRSSWYVDKYNLTATPVFEPIIEQLENLLCMDDYDIIAGIAVGSILFAHALALKHEKTFLIVRPDIPDHGLQRAVQGYTGLVSALGGNRTLLVEDVCTTGHTAMKAIDRLEACEFNYAERSSDRQDVDAVSGASTWTPKVHTLLSIVERDDFSKENLMHGLQARKVKRKALFAFTEVLG